MNVLSQKNSRTLFGLLLVVAMSAGVVWYVREGQARTTGEPTVRNTEVSFITDFSDARKLVGAVDNVFLGRVKAQQGTHTNAGATPWTLFEVEVLHNIKGSLQGTVIVEQQGGFDEEDNAIILVENDPLLQPEQTYLFASKRNGDVHTIVPGYGDVPVRDVQGRAQVIQTFTQALREQIPYNGPSR